MRIFAWRSGPGKPHFDRLSVKHIVCKKQPVMTGKLANHGRIELRRIAPV